MEPKTPESIHSTSTTTPNSLEEKPNVPQKRKRGGKKGPRKRYDQEDARTEIELYNCVNEWVERETRPMYRHGSSDERRAKLDRCYKENLEIFGMSWRIMERETRWYHILPKLQRRIVIYMKSHNIIGRAEDREKIEELCQELGLGITGKGPLQQDFVHLCRKKVVNFIKTKAAAMKKMGYVRFDRKTKYVEWEASTEAWLDPDWDGDINPPRKSITVPNLAEYLAAKRYRVASDAQQPTAVAPHLLELFPLDEIDLSGFEIPEPEVLEYEAPKSPAYIIPSLLLPTQGPSPGPLLPLKDPDHSLCVSYSCPDEVKTSGGVSENAGMDGSSLDWEDIDLALTVPVYSFEAEEFQYPDD